MPIQIKIGNAVEHKTLTLELNIRKSLNGDLMIFDHGDIDIVLSEASNKIVTFPKDTISDVAYGAQNRLFSFLTKKGIVEAKTIRSGNIYGSLEGGLLKGYKEEIKPLKYALVNISKFIDEERPYFEHVEALVSGNKDELTNPDETHSTELGEVPQNVEQGSLRHSYIKDPYYYSYMYTME